jgi:hypothetical protein
VGFFATSGILNRRGFFGGAQAFSPSNIAGLSFWLDATTGLFDATSGGSAVTTDGSAVARWEDQSGNSRHITQATLASRPILKTAIQNGKNIIRFDGTNDILRRSGAFVHDQGAATIFVVVSANSGAGDRLVVEGRTTSTNPLYMPIISASATLFQVLYRINSGTIPLNNVSFGTAFNGTGFKLVCALDSGTNFAGFINKVTTNNQNYTRGAVTLDTFAIGGWATTIERDFFPGDVAEVIIYNTALGTTDRQSVEDYLYSKWGIV